MISEGEPVRAVLDTNILVSAFIRNEGAPAMMLRAAGRGLFTLVLSEVLCEELRGALAYPRVRKAGRYKPEEAAEFLRTLARTSEIIPGPASAPAVLAADPDDDWIIATALEGAADVIVTGDKAMLDLGSHAGISIMTPVAFLEELTRRTP